jgi:hypothetical protein
MTRRPNNPADVLFLLASVGQTAMLAFVLLGFHRDFEWVRRAKGHAS